METAGQNYDTKAEKIETTGLNYSSLDTQLGKNPVKNL